MSRQNYLFTSESVSEGHPDKVCDRISDTIVDAFLARHPDFTLTPACAILASHGIELEGELLRLLPHRHHTDGFFAAVLDRKS